MKPPEIPELPSLLFLIIGSLLPSVSDHRIRPHVPYIVTKVCQMTDTGPHFLPYLFRQSQERINSIQQEGTHKVNVKEPDRNINLLH